MLNSSWTSFIESKNSLCDFSFFISTSSLVNKVWKIYSDCSHFAKASASYSAKSKTSGVIESKIGVET